MWSPQEGERERERQRKVETKLRCHVIVLLFLFDLVVCYRCLPLAEATQHAAKIRWTTGDRFVLRLSFWPESRGHEIEVNGTKIPERRRGGERDQRRSEPANWTLAATLGQCGVGGFGGTPQSG